MDKIEYFIAEAKKFDVSEEGIELLKSLKHLPYYEKKEVLNGLKNKIPIELVKFYANEKFDWFQKREIRYAIEKMYFDPLLKGKTPPDNQTILKKINIFAKPEFEGMQMRILRWALIDNGIDEKFVRENMANPDLSYEEMDKIRKDYLQKNKNKKRIANGIK